MAIASVLHGEIVCFLDADSADFGAHFACGLLGPLLCRPEISFVKGFYRRPFRIAGQVLPEGGGRCPSRRRARANMFYPELAGVEQPLAGEVAARRELLERLPFASGYGVDIGLLLDAYREVGLDGIAQVDLDVRQTRTSPSRARPDGLRRAPGGEPPPPARGAARRAAAERSASRRGRAGGRWPAPRSSGHRSQTCVPPPETW